jgi:hypothetical protein
VEAVETTLPVTVRQTKPLGLKAASAGALLRHVASTSDSRAQKQKLASRAIPRPGSQITTVFLE